ncbi:MAG: acyltransferase family protein [Bacteroidetes bacterium]|nr:acyltransferase family protein [Bacteroidota bacterium]
MEFLRTYKHLNIEDTNILKGLSILLIGFHNYLNNINQFNSFGISEFYFNDRSLNNWLNFLTWNPIDWIVCVLSFLGHYGVSAFVLISGYGLSMGFKNRVVSYFPFFFSRIKKIYPAFFLGVVIAVIIAIITHRYPDNSELWRSVFWRLSLLSVFKADMMYALYGPWWFFGLIFSLYALFPLLIFLLKKNYLLAYWGLMLVLFILPHIHLIHTNEAYYASALYQLPIFGVGAYLGFQSELKMPKYIAIPALFFLLYGQGNFVIWKFTHLSGALLILLLVIILRRMQWKINNIIAVCGVLSFHFFVIHPIIRAPFLDVAENINSIYFTVLIGVIYVVTAFGAAWLFKIIDEKFKRLIFKQ